MFLQESKALQIDDEVVTKHMAMNWDELDDVFFNFSKIDEKIQSDFHPSKLLEKFHKSIHKKGQQVDSHLFVEMPLFDSSSSTILMLPEGLFLLEVIRENIYLNRLGF